MKTMPDWLKQADQAMQRAALRARELAARTGTSIHIWKDGKIVEIKPTSAASPPPVKPPPNS